MKFALVNNHREEAQPNLKGECPSCNSPMIARCGERRIYHWAHLGHRICDPWWENETDWHRNWKNQFPTNWQEIVHHAQDGERHIADVKTSANWVIEFQHSPIKSEEKRSREHFYKHLIWVVNGVRRERDKGGQNYKYSFPRAHYFAIGSTVQYTLFLILAKKHFGGCFQKAII